MKTIEKVMLDLYDVCRLGLYDKVSKILEEHPEEIDFDVHGAQIFEFIIGDKETKILKTLLDFYASTKLQGDPESLEYKWAYKKLQSILEEASEANNITPEIEAILTPYLTKDEESDNEQDLSGFDIDSDYEEHDYSNIQKRSSSASEFLAHQNAPRLLHSSSESLVSNKDSFNDDNFHESKEVLGQNPAEPLTD